MKTIVKTLLGLLTIFLFVDSAVAQDKLIKNNNDTITCIIKEIGDLEIKYTNPEVSETILFGIDKEDVSKIILANGKEMEFSSVMFDPEKYANNNKNALKVNFLSPLFNSLKLSYERSLQPGRSIEFELGIIGVGNDIYLTDEKGVCLKVGYKLIKSPDYYLRGQRYAHILKGAYIRPELAFSTYSYDYEVWDWDYEGTTRERNTMFAVLLNFGKQWVIDDGFVVDTFLGVGYGFGDDDESYGMHKAFIGGIDEFPIALTSGVRIGWCF
ncbi:hypothetical protein [Carboxylicivirga linearis]|uniref:DUF3575 domain-containing protein n=1 Tax=Carboxylicivirga linearis TaxID=1628157 RepID=A0ABS5K012_9BACT|nr:hypothetical protein [Carboxylicivirga linearis]MBS2100448.1 hypothetical protein [Carboxylicivirga linearis]